MQRKGIDFEEIYAPFTRLETVRLLLALAAKHSWEVHHLDVKTAFLNGKSSRKCTFNNLKDLSKGVRSTLSTDYTRRFTG